MKIPEMQQEIKRLSQELSEAAAAYNRLKDDLNILREQLGVSHPDKAEKTVNPLNLGQYEDRPRPSGSIGSSPIGVY